MPELQGRGAVVVVGAGLLGISTAWELLGRGWEVTLLEAGESVALATSHANGGLLTRAMSDPWNAPGVHRSLVTALLGSNESMTVRASVLPSLWSWGLRFMRSSTRLRHGTAVVASFRLADYSLRKVRELSEATGLNFDQASRGTLKIFRDRSSEETAVALATQMGAHGLRYEILDRSKTLECEPQLTGIRDNIKGSIYFPAASTTQCVPMTPCSVSTPQMRDPCTSSRDTAILVCNFPPAKQKRFASSTQYR